MTEEEKAAHDVFLAWETAVKLSELRPTLVETGNNVLALAERLLKENSELRVRDSNVTFHSKNVMGINEDLQAKLAVLKTAVEETINRWARETGDGSMWGEDAWVLGPIREAVGNPLSEEETKSVLTVLNNQSCATCKHWARGGTNHGTVQKPVHQCCGMSSIEWLGCDTDCWFGTTPDFGCRDWESKNETDQAE